jgi:hypothetical protein
MENLQSERLIHSRDFKELDFSGIDNVQWFEFEGDTVLGPFHNEEVTFSLDQLPSHNVLRITIELLAHDSWDGNSYNIGGPDFWYLQVDGQEVMRTTFSNSICESLYCLYQSYPENYVRQFEPKSGAIQTDLPGRCQYEGIPNLTSRYEINKLVRHRGGQVSILMGDELKQENAADPKCDESWSVSRITIHALSVN